MPSCKRFIVVGVYISDYDAADEGQFDTRDEAEALVRKLVSSQTNDTGYRFYYVDLDPDPYEGGHR